MKHVSGPHDSRWASADAYSVEGIVLVIATFNTALAGRVSIALADVGFRVAALTPPGHPARRLRTVSTHFTYHARPRLRSITFAMNKLAPDLLVCVDDPAVEELQALHRRMVGTAGEASQRILKLIERSLGPAASNSVLNSKSALSALADESGLRIPRTVILPAARKFEIATLRLNYPIVVKADQSFGGRCVRFVHDEKGVRAAIWELQTPAAWRDVIRRLIGVALTSGIDRVLKLQLRRTISLQQYIDGRPGNRAVVCWEGKVLSAISVEAIEVTGESGPASVVRVINNPEMKQAADLVVARLKLSGFIGFDFILDSDDRAWLLEMNPRATPVCHFRLMDGTNLAGSLYAQLTRRPPRPVPATIAHDPVALFPNEVVRSPTSEYLRDGLLDVPWHEPEFVCSALSDALRVRIGSRLREYLRRFKMRWGDQALSTSARTKGGGLETLSRDNGPASSEIL